jgi:asparagine synthase (glutamine-hydrolysing)
MCGFLAILDGTSNVNGETARSALDTIAHRGPDAAGEWHDGNVLLLHRRLSIIDLSTGQQPMQSHDSRFVIVFNGEIYNFSELRNELEKEGCKFHTRSDTEVILEGYRCWGQRVVERLSGMFAFVIWDRLRSMAFGARDRLGIKPLCWAMRQGGLVVSSTLEPFKVLKGFHHIDPIAVRDLLTFDYIPSPRTVLQGVNKLDPGCRFSWHLGDNQPFIERYWSPPLQDGRLASPSQDELEELLAQAIRRQMISDVPIGVFLSGGIDSSLIVALMARHSKKPISTFSVAFENEEVDESPIARLVARHFGTDHTVLRADELGPRELLELLGRLDEPFADAAFVPTYSLSKMTAGYVKVILSGDGGDEVFGGYPKYSMGKRDQLGYRLQPLLHKFLQGLPWRPRGVGHLYSLALSSQDRIRWSWAGYGDFPIFRKDLSQVLTPPYHEPAEIRKYFEPWERLANRYGRRFDTDLLMRTDLQTYLSENCLVKTDRASMLASLEVRVPYLDDTILDRILPLTAERKLLNGQLKALLVPIAKRLLPKEVWNRPKHGFNVPLDRWLKGRWRPAVEAALEWGEANMDLFNFRYLRRLHKINICEGGIGRELWNPFVFLAWAMAREVKL